MELLTRPGYLQEMYTASRLLESQGCPREEVLNAAELRGGISSQAPVKLQPDGSLLVTSDGLAKIVLDGGRWDPLEKHRLSLGIASSGGQDAPRVIGVTFEGRLRVPYSVYHLDVGPSSPRCQSVDLLQLPAYALNQEVGNVELHLSAPGVYAVRYIAFE
jgi:hypothetical protein